MTAVYDLRDRSIAELHPTEHALKGEVRDLFAVPERCSVGTTSIGNAITVLDLCGPKVKYDTVVRGFAREAGGGSMVFLPGYGKDTIGYAKARSFFVVNFERREVQRYRLAPILEYTIDDVAVIDWSKRLFAVSLNFTQSAGTATEVQVVDLSGVEVRILAELEIKDDPRWAMPGRVTFYFSRKGDTYALHALDERLREVPHPLLEPFQRYFSQSEADLPLVHPSLPFAVFATLEPDPGPGLTFRLVTWRGGANKPEAVMVAKSKSGPFRFSPDGRWLLFLDRSTGPDRLMVMPIDPALPYYLCPPVVLQTTEKIDELGSNCAWITDPPAVVCTINRTEHVSTTGEERPVNKLLKWELPRRAGQR